MPAVINVLIVEDHQITRAGLAAAFAGLDDFCLIASAGDAAHGLKLARQLKPDIVLLDLHLPGGQGPASMVEEFCKIGHSKIVVFSAESRPAFVQLIIKAGVAGYLLKSEAAERVVEILREVARQKVDRPVLSRELLCDQKQLSKAQQQILQLLAKGMKYKEIADQRATSVATVRSQCEYLQLVLDLNSREELIAWAVTNGYGSL